MAVTGGGSMTGSVGGGIMEHKFVELAKEKLMNNRPTLELVKQFHDKESARNQSGMICSGEQTILLYRVQPKDQLTISHIVTCLEKQQCGTLQLSPGGISFHPAIDTATAGFSFEDYEHWNYSGILGLLNKLYIIGGGHCALALSALMSQLQFYIIVYDNRKDLHTMRVNDFSHELITLSDYSHLDKMISANENTYVVIMTFGYRTDDTALRALMGKRFRYLGILGSKAKLKKMFDDYRREGMDEKILQQVHAPVGLLINSQTPEEIAVSIAAEIISVKNGLSKSSYQSYPATP